MGRHSCRPTPSSIPTGPSPPPRGGGGSPPRRQHRNEATTGLLRGYYESYYEATTRLQRGYYAATTRLLPGHYQATTRLLRGYYQEPHARHSASSTAAAAPLVSLNFTHGFFAQAAGEHAAVLAPMCLYLSILFMAIYPLHRRVRQAGGNFYSSLFATMFDGDSIDEAHWGGIEEDVALESEGGGGRGGNRRRGRPQGPGQGNPIPAGDAASLTTTLAAHHRPSPPP